MELIRKNIQDVQQRIERACDRSHRSADEITLVAVTKSVDAMSIESAYECGLRDFGENRVQEAERKITELSALRSQVTWHMIGHVQTNKVKPVIRFFDMIQSVDSIKLATRLDSHLTEPLPVLVQVNISEEMTKGGFSRDQVTGAVKEISGLPHLDVKGLMTIAPLTDNMEEVRPIFRTLRKIRDELGLEHISMGMSDDYEIAIEEGATIVRIGRAIFSERRN
jgi:pyridoxal phosphate enzyme (YggS family)